MEDGLLVGADVHAWERGIDDAIAGSRFLYAFTVFLTTGARGAAGLKEAVRGRESTDMVLYEHESGRRDQRSAVVTAFGIDPTDVAVATWRGLRDLQGRLDGRSWPHPFPTAQVANLTQAIRRRKHDRGARPADW